MAINMGLPYTEVKLMRVVEKLQYKMQSGEMGDVLELIFTNADGEDHAFISMPNFKIWKREGQELLKYTYINVQRQNVAENHENIHATTAPDLSTSVVQTKPKNMDGSSNKNPIILSSENCKKLCDKIYNIIEKYYPICFSKNFKKEYKDRYVNFTCYTSPSTR